MIVLPRPGSTSLAAGAVDIEDLLGLAVAGCALQHVLPHRRPTSYPEPDEPRQGAQRHGPGTATREPARRAARRLLDLTGPRPAARAAADRPAVAGRRAGGPPRPDHRGRGRPAPPGPVLRAGGQP